MSRSRDAVILRRTALRIGIQTGVAVAITVLVLSGVAILVVLQSQHQAQNDLIDTAIARADDVNDPPAGIWLIMRKDGSLSASPGLPAGLPDTDQLDLTAADHSARSVDLTLHHREFRVRTQPYGSAGVIQAVLDLAADNAQRTRLMDAFLLVGGFGLVLSAAIGAWLGRRAVAPMADALALQRRFVADAGHELRTPLTLLSTRAQLIRRSLRQRPDPVTLESDVDNLVRDTSQLAGILDDLLLSVDPRESVVAERVDLGGLAERVVERVRPAAEGRDVSLSLSASGANVVLGSETGLGRALTALLDNAVRHARAEVVVSVGSVGGDLVAEVSDDGPGIDPAILPTLFARFATTPADGARGGARRYGLGLALVSEIAAHHGGSVSVVKTDGGGATFRLRLPNADAAQKTPRILRKALRRQDR
jgi:signal transduction histidine kinase